MKNLVTTCNQCKDETNHHVLFKKRIVRLYESSKIKKSPAKDIEDYMVIQCKGCNGVTFLMRESGDFFDGNNNESYYFDHNYPEIEDDSIFNFLSHQDQLLLPKKLQDLLEEVAFTFRYGSNKLAGVGLRMLVEAICIEQNIRGQNLKVKIEKLHEHGFISKNEVPILDKLRELGNASAHGIKSFTLDKLAYALDIINHILKSIYVLPKIDKKLKI